MFAGDDPDCFRQVIPGPECNDSGGTYTTYSVTFDSLDADTALTADTYNTDPSMANCPSDLWGSTTGRVTNPQTGDLYQFSSNGHWVLDLGQSWILLPSSQAVYLWPQSPTGWWPGFNISNGSTAARIKVASARAVCHGGGSVSFIRFYGVQVLDDNLRQTSDGGGGGDGGGTPPGCEWQYIVVEIDHGDGTWHELWSGMALVCE